MREVAATQAMKRRDSVSGQAQDNIGEDELLAFIVKKENVGERKCKEKLKKYCKGLSDANVEPKEIHKELEKLCKGIEMRDGNCKTLEQKVSEKCTVFKNGFRSKLKNLKDEDCTKNERQCMLLETACPVNLKKDCNDLRNKCYQKKRDEVAVEVLLRALGDGSLKKSTPPNNDECEPKLKEVCKELNDKSNELANKCLDTNTCASLVKTIKEKCKTLTTKVSSALNNPTNETCQSLLEQCYFYSLNCENDKPKCDELVKKCSKQKITFVPPDQPFDPIKPPATLTQKIGLNMLYEKAAQDGVHIGSASTSDVFNLLALLTPKNTGTEIDKACKDMLDKNCSSLKTEYPMLKDLCGDNGKASQKGTQMCNDLKNRLNSLPENIKDKLGGQDASNAIPWYQLKELREEDCEELESLCSYFLPHKGSTLSTPCANVRVACYKRGLGAVANEALEDRLRGLFNETNSKPDKLLSELVEKCKELKTSGDFSNDELLSRCLQPDDARLLLLSDLRYKRMTLHFQLNEKRDFPNEKDCETLKRKCEALGKDFDTVHNPCATLRSHCNRLRQAVELEGLLLVKTKGSLKDKDSCEKKVKDICKKDARLGKNGRSFACANTTFTCQTITDNVKRKCHFLGQNIGIRNATTEISSKNTTDEKEDLCDFWESYCDTYMSHSDTLSNKTNGGEGECTKLKNACQDYRKKRELEDQVMVKLAGSLTDDTACKGAFNTYCSTPNKTSELEALCKKNDTGKPPLCEKLVRRVEEKCVGLSEKLNKEKQTLNDEKDKYDKLKREAEKEIEKANFVLAKASTVGTSNSIQNVSTNPSTPNVNNTQGTNTNASSSNGSSSANSTRRFAKRSGVQVEVTAQDVFAFEKASDALTLYDELKTKCEALSVDCLFRVECDDCMTICEKIDKICHELKPLEVKEQTIKVITNVTTIKENVTITKTKTETTEASTCSLTCSASATCTTVRTTDTWVTHTSTHTSTSTQTSTITSTVTFTSTRRCKPTKCTTEGGGDEEGHVKPSGGVRISGGNVMKSLVLTILVWMLM